MLKPSQMAYLRQRRLVYLQPSEQNNHNRTPAPWVPEPEQLAEQLREEDARKEFAREGNLVAQRFENITQQSLRPILHIKAVFPFDFFPDEVMVDVNKISIIRHSFLFHKVHNTNIKDVLDVLVHVAPFFATLEIVDIGFTEHTIKVNYLKKNEAIHAQKVISGLVLSTKQDLDLSKVDYNELREKIAHIGDAKSWN